MSTSIQWTDEVWNPVVGCSPVSEGCRNCYAAKEAVRLGGNPHPKIGGLYRGLSEMRGVGLARRAVFTGKVNLVPERLEEPLRWRKPRRVFVNSMSDLFHDAVPFDFIDRVFAVMAMSPQHTFQILTKRPERMAAYMVKGVANRIDRAVMATQGWSPVALDRARSMPLANVWLGTSVEHQEAADERIPHLLRTPAAVRFLSCEPLLEGVDLRRHINGWCPKCGSDGNEGHFPTWGCLRDGLPRGRRICPRCRTSVELPDYRLRTIRGEEYHFAGIDWIIVGGESGAGARPFDIAWAERIIDECREAGVAVFCKQLGALPIMDDARWRQLNPTPLLRAANHKKTPRGSVPLFLNDKKGGDPEEWPESVRVREFPKVGV